uniref:Tetraspanin n=1 Tax=Macrostomum lignano TaxID=282301 RepID=A0A1I8GV14_9PLAT
MASLKRSGAALIFLSFLLIVIAAAMLIFDLVNFLKLNRESKEFTTAATSTRSFSQSVLSIILGVLGLLLGVCGIVGFCVLLIGITIDFLSRILLISLMLISCTRTHEITETAMRQAMDYYGSTANSTGIRFTKAVNSFAEKELCCNWVGADHSDNLFKHSTWHRQLLKKHEVVGQLKLDHVNRKSERILLPVHCCTAVQPLSGHRGKGTLISAPSATGYCTGIYNMEKARKRGAIHAQDCLDLITKRMRTLLYIYSGAHAAVILVYALTGVAAFQFLKSSVTEPDKSVRGQVMDDINEEDRIENKTANLKLDGRGRGKVEMSDEDNQEAADERPTSASLKGEDF